MKRLSVVLVHGAWLGGWCWQHVAEHLLDRGHRVFAPTLTGLCERSHLTNPSINLTTHVQDIVNEVEWKRLDDIVLCGHSYGGMVISGALDHIHRRVAAAVYVDAFLPLDGGSVNDIVGSQHTAVDGMVMPPAAGELGPASNDARSQVGRCTPQSAACFSERLGVPRGLDRIRTRIYVGAAHATVPVFAATFRTVSADPAWQTHLLDSGHNVMFDRPLELADILVGAAAA